MPETDNLTDQELLHDAVRSTEQEIQDAAWTEEPGDEPAAEEQAVDEDQAPQADAAGEQPRNDKGQFASKAKPDAQQQEQPEQQQGQQEQQDGKAEDGENVPRWRTREIAEERRQAIAERDQLRVEMARLQAQLARPAQPAQQQQQQQEAIDPLIDPQGFAQRLQSIFDEKLRAMELNSDLRIAHVVHKEVFEKAYEALIQEGQRGNGQLARQLTAQPQGAGDRIVNWYRNRELIRETKGDLQGYEKTLRERLLKDPEFLKAAMDAGRQMANGGQQPGQQQQGQRPNNITRLPPSLSRQAGGSPNSDPIDTDDREKAVFDYAFNG